MAEFTVHLQAVANATVTLDVPDAVAEQGPEAIAEYIWQYGDMPSICAQCSGWRQKYSLELGEFETTNHEAGSPHEGVAYVIDADGKEVVDE